MQHATCRANKNLKKDASRNKPQGRAQAQAQAQAPGAPGKASRLVLVWPGPLVVRYPACSFWSCRGAAHCALGNGTVSCCLLCAAFLESRPTSPRIRPPQRAALSPSSQALADARTNACCRFLAPLAGFHGTGGKGCPGFDGGGVALDHLTSHRLIDCA
jgi:hypothetical protein